MDANTIEEPSHHDSNSVRCVELHRKVGSIHWQLDQQHQDKGRMVSISGV